MSQPSTPFLLEIAVEPASARDLAALLAALAAIAASRPGVAFVHVGETCQTIVRGHDEKGLNAAIVELRDRHGIALRIGAPQVAYRETLTGRIEVNTTHKKIVDGSGAFARVKMVFEPGAGRPFEAALPKGAIPAEFIAGVARGVEVARGAGVQAGFPVVDVEATLVDGAWHATDSSPAAFETAAITAFREAQRQAGMLLEPIMRVEVSAPQDYTGAIHGDLEGRRGAIERLPRQAGGPVVAFVPLANLLGYPAQLRSLTEGRGSFAMAFSHFAPIPPPEPPRFPQAAALRA